MKEEIEVSIRHADDVAIADISGDLTAANAGGVETAYKRMSVEGAKKILFSFDGKSYINSGGIAVLIGVVAEGRELGQAIRLTGLSAHFEKVLKIVGLTRYTQIFPSEESALEDWKGS